MASTLLYQLIFEEGFRATPYLCTAGKRTIGYGHNLETRPWFKGKPIPEKITKEFAEEILISDIKKARDDLEREWPQSLLLSQARLDACVNMAFQLGAKGFMEFRNMRRALIAGDWKAAHEEALNSAWARQTPSRAGRVAGQLLSGEYYAIPDV